MTSSFDWAPQKPTGPLDDPFTQAAGGWRHDPRKTLLDFVGRHFRGKPATLKSAADHWNDLASSNSTIGIPDERVAEGSPGGNARMSFVPRSAEPPRRFDPITQDELLKLLQSPEFMDSYYRGRSKGVPGTDDDVRDLATRILGQNRPEAKTYIPRDDGIPLPGLDDAGRQSFMKSKTRSFPDNFPQTTIGGRKDQGYLSMFPSARERFWRRHGTRGSNDGEQ